MYEGEGYTTNNKYPSFPPIMADQRALVASFQPSAVVNEEILKQANLRSNWEYRKYMTSNADEIRKYNFLETSTDVGYTVRPIDLLQLDQFSPPYQFQSVFDNSYPRGYESGDLKNIYLSREQLDARRISPAITQEELLKRGIIPPSNIHNNNINL